MRSTWTWGPHRVRIKIGDSWRRRNRIGDGEIASTFGDDTVVVDNDDRIVGMTMAGWSRG